MAALGRTRAVAIACVTARQRFRDSSAPIRDRTASSANTSWPSRVVSICRAEVGNSPESFLEAAGPGAILGSHLRRPRLLSSAVATRPSSLPQPFAVLRAEYGEVSAVAGRVGPAGLTA